MPPKERTAQVMLRFTPTELAEVKMISRSSLDHLYLPSVSGRAMNLGQPVTNLNLTPQSP